MTTNSFNWRKEAEIIHWCKNLGALGYGLEIIQLESQVGQIRPTPFKDGFFWKFLVGGI